MVFFLKTKNMAFNITVLNSCKFLAINASSYGEPTGDVVITGLGNITGSYTATITYDVSTGNGYINIPVSNLPAANGVYRACLEEAGIAVSCKPVLIHCDIDCCLTKLTNELLDCACDCPKCASSLARAQKVFLLLESANSTVELASTSGSSSGYYEDIVDKYNKAKQICDNSCGCDC